MVDDYYADEVYEDYTEPYDEKNNPAPSVWPIKKLVLAAAVIFLLMFFVILQNNLLVVDDSPIKLSNKIGGTITMKGSVSFDGNIVDTFSIDGETLSTTMNPDDKKAKITFNVQGLSEGTSTGKVTIKSGGLVFASNPEFTVGEDGQISINLSAIEDADFFDGQVIDANVLIEIETDTDGDGEVDELVIIEVPLEVIIQQYMTLGCLSLEKTEVFKSTENGMLETEFLFKSNCNLSDPLRVAIEWKDERIGTVDFFIDGKDGQNLTENAITMKDKLSTSSEYTGKVIFLPFTKYAGEEAIFKLLLGYGDTVAEINFELALENLEQCVNFTNEDLVIENSSDRASVTIDVSTCHSDRIEFFICPNDDGCSGGADEGKIEPSSSYFYLSPENRPSRTINIERGNIPGVYGLTVYASVAGHDETLIAEKEILVVPSTTILKPDKFVISLLGPGTSDTIRISHSELTEDVDIDSTICNLQKQSTKDQGWWREYATDSKRYPGSGKYQASLYNALTWIDYAQGSAASISGQENYKIKQNFSQTVDAYDAVKDIYVDTETAVELTQNMDDAIDETVDLEATSIGLSVISLVTSGAALVNSYTTTCDAANTAEPFVKTASAYICGGGSALNIYEGARTSICGVGLKRAYDIYQMANQINGIYDSIVAANEDNTIDSGEATEYAEEAMDYMSDAFEHSRNAIDYMVLALDAESVDSTTTVSSGAMSAADYIALAKSEQLAAKESIENANASIASSSDAITLLSEEVDKDFEYYNNLVYTGSQLVELLSMPFMASDATILENTSAALEQMRIAGCTGCDKVQSACVAAVSAAQAPVTAVQSAHAANISSLAAYVGYTSTAISAFDMYQQSSNRGATEIGLAKVHNTTLIGDYLLAIVASDVAQASADAASTGARNLSLNARASSLGSDYLHKNYIAGKFNQERLSGLISTAISVGFINGAYAGGVYETDATTGGGASISFSENDYEKKIANFSTDVPTSDSILSSFTEDCANHISLTLPDYKVNLLQDYKPTQVPGGKVLAAWPTQYSNVYDVLEEQEVGMKFVNNSLYKNTYETITLKFDKHSHASLTTVTGEFGPFNIPDSSVETVEEKFHFKFNAKPREAATPVTKTIGACTKGLLRGETGEDALAKNQFTWNWDEIDDSKYLDATQLSIVLSDKLAQFNDVLQNNTGNCPLDPAMVILGDVKPTDVGIVGADCYLPMSTWEYDGKPALYYYLEGGFTPTETVRSIQEFLKLLDFNVYLIKDGYGIEFQDDFEREYTSQAFASNIDFTDPSKGISKYFANDRYAYYSSEAQGYSASSDFIIPDAGKYEVKILAELEDWGLFSGGSPSAKLVFDLYPIAPVNDDFSPFYYLPIDGGVGIENRNDRRGYGIGGLEEITVNKSDGIYISPEQENAMLQIETNKIESFFSSNSLNSNRGKVLDARFVYNPKPNTVEGSKIEFSPVYATPLILAVPGNPNSYSSFSYYPQKGSTKQRSDSLNMLFLTGVDKCSYYGSGDLSKTINFLPDNLSGDNYYVALDAGSGTAFLKTVVFSPTESEYAIKYDAGVESGYLITTDGESDGSVALGGVSGMKYNDSGSGAYLVGLKDVYNAVAEEELCVSRFGDREIYWWPEDSIYATTNSSNRSMPDVESGLISQCN